MKGAASKGIRRTKFCSLRTPHVPFSGSRPPTSRVDGGGYRAERSERQTDAGQRQD